MTAVREALTEGGGSEKHSTPLSGRAAAKQRRRQRRLVLFSMLVFIMALAVGAGLRLWHLGISPAWQWDEAVYYRVSQNVQDGVLTEHSVYGVYPPEPFLYQPPFYFLLLVPLVRHHRASASTTPGSSGVILTTAMQVTLFRLLWKIHGPRCGPVRHPPGDLRRMADVHRAVSRTSRTLLMLIIAASFLLYQRALDRPSWQRFAIAGAAIGFAAELQANRLSTCC